MVAIYSPVPVGHGVADGTAKALLALDVHGVADIDFADTPSLLRWRSAPPQRISVETLILSYSAGATDEGHYSSGTPWFGINGGRDPSSKKPLGEWMTVQSHLEDDQYPRRFEVYESNANGVNSVLELAGYQGVKIPK
ncbi:unnamed protein product, partial [Symbiodinium sp. KB8]